MIVKQVDAKIGTKGSFKALSDYLLDKKNDSQKVDFYTFSNCPFENNSQNIEFISQMQQLNTTTKGAKTLHIVVSFQEEEKPSREILEKIEEELLDALEMNNHHRLSVIHNNTNNYHLHIAVNRIEPETHKKIDPSFSKLKLQKRATELEKKFNLKADNHLKQNKSEERGWFLEEFKIWVKERIGKELKSIFQSEKASIDEIHMLLAKYNLRLKSRADGFVIADKSRQLFLKASLIDRDLSKPNLIKRFKEVGEFNVDSEPLEKFESHKLHYWQSYKEQTNAQKNQQKELFTIAKSNHSERFLAINKEAKQKKEQLKAMKNIHFRAKKPYLQELEVKRNAELQLLKESYAQERKRIFKQTKQICFEDYLIDKILAGDSFALDILRNQKVINPKEGDNVITGEQNSTLFLDKNPTILKNGFVFYAFNEAKIIDKGSCLKIINGDDRVIIEALKMGILKYGKALEINGDNSFKRKVIDLVLKENINIVFKNKEMRTIFETQKMRFAR